MQAAVLEKPIASGATNPVAATTARLVNETVMIG